MGRKSHTNVENHPVTIWPKFILNCQSNFCKKRDWNMKSNGYRQWCRETNGQFWPGKANKVPDVEIQHLKQMGMPEFSKREKNTIYDGHRQHNKQE